VALGKVTLIDESRWPSTERQGQYLQMSAYKEYRNMFVMSACRGCGDKKRPRGSASLAAQAICGTKAASQLRNTKCLKKQRRRLSCVANTPKPM
jgi:hypothetical protein